MRRFVLTLLYVSSALISSAGFLQAHAADNWTTLQKAAVAAHALSYQGIFVYQTTQQATAVQITHLFNGQGEYARNVVLDGTPREVFSQGHDLVIFNPKSEHIVIEKRRAQNMFPATLPVDLSSVKESYELKIGEIERVADRAAQVIYLQPKDGLRYQYKCWVDLEYGLLLKTEMTDSHNALIETIGFNQVALMHTLDLDWFQPKIDSKKSYIMEEAVSELVTTPSLPSWTIKSAPVGYKLIEQNVKMVHGKNIPLTHLVFSDGLASVSLFIEPVLRGAKVKVGRVSDGFTSYFASVSSGYQITAVGEVPEATVEKFASAVRFKK